MPLTSPSATTLPHRQAGQSVSARVFIGTTIIVLAFSGLVSYAIYLYRQTAAEMALLNSTYIPLTIGASEVRSTQVVFNTLMDRLADDPAQTLTRDWINAARRYRPAMLFKLTQLINNTLNSHSGLPDEERLFLQDIRDRLHDVRSRYRTNESRFITLFATVDTGQRTEAMSQIENLKRSERLLNKVLSGIGADVKQHITEVSSEAVDKANTATMFLGFTSALLMSLGIGLIISTARLLAPLKKLQAAVARVTAGDLDTNIRIFRDDEIGALTESFNTMTRALIDRDRMLIRQEQLATAGKIAAQVTHEIRNPLSSLGLNADLLKDELSAGGSPDEARTLLAAMTDEIERLTGITESYLQFARLPAPNPRFNDPAEFIESTATFMKNELSEANIDIAVDIAPDMEQWVFDRGQLRQALINLLRNAMEAMTGGGQIRIDAFINDGDLIIRVSDNGPGVSESIRDRIFDPFFTTKTTGNGLGLAMVRQICLAHSGRIQYDRGQNDGTVFTMFFPATSSHPIEAVHDNIENPQ